MVGQHDERWRMMGAGSARWMVEREGKVVVFGRKGEGSVLSIALPVLRQLLPVSISNISCWQREKSAERLVLSDSVDGGQLCSNRSSGNGSDTRIAVPYHTHDHAGGRLCCNSEDHRCRGWGAILLQAHPGTATLKQQQQCPIQAGTVPPARKERTRSRGSCSH